MHQTVREFFLDSGGPVAESKFAMHEKDAHVCISITCIRYLMLCAANNISTEELPDIKCWASEHFKDYAQRLDEKPLANYALSHLKHHIDGCQGDANVQNIVSQFIGKLNDNPATYLLGSWVNSCLNKILLRSGEVTAATDFKNKVLHTAVRNRLPTAAEMLLTAGANVNERDQEGRTPLSWAAEGGHQTMVKLLLETGKADVDSKDRNGRTPLSLAAEGGHEAVVKQLLQTGMADVGSEDYDDRTPLSFAEWRGHDAVVRLLINSNQRSDSSSLDSSLWGSIFDVLDDASSVCYNPELGNT